MATCIQATIITKEKKKKNLSTLEPKEFDKDMVVVIGDSKEEMQLYIYINIVITIGK